MPVNFDEYRTRQEETELPFDPDTHAYHILGFLGKHPDRGYKPAEIAAETDIKPGSVRGTLKRLKDRGLVEHAEPYWSFGDDDRLAALSGTMLSLKAIGDRYGDDEFEGWDENAVDPREMRDE
ncbi:MarR family transcriptional regulator [Halorientalis salina]|uniref:MarR family transcriptional regulator n=1 Tax=Halorientalis salina TaxID=2932266 RepID=UPI00145DDE59|nr:helix-turn-helix domain-containing protein [Halorientalis salina]